MVGNKTVIKKGATLTGPVIIGDNCTIESDAHIGPNTSIGDNSKIAKCNIENSIIMSGCNIDGTFKIKNSIIAFNCNIIHTDGTGDKVFLLGEGTKISL